MFKEAYEIASKYIKPLIVVLRYQDKSVECGLGTLIILNDEGWIMTAAHNLNASNAYNQHQLEIKMFQEKVDKINANPKLNENKRKRLIKAVKSNPKWITDFIIWLGADKIQIKESFVYNDHDIAFIRIDKLFMKGITEYPKIKDPRNLKQGTSLCKLGFPFYHINATFDETTNKFIFPKNTFPIPRFPIEGIYTRNLITGKSNDKTMDVMYIETSSPGLKGQSGGPIIDIDGNIYAVQSQNYTLPLGFKGKEEINGIEIEESQFINVGVGVHTETIVTLLKKHKIKHDIAP
ncbi:MAG: serine protease [Candidatus Kapaibacterium sp.]